MIDERGDPYLGREIARRARAGIPIPIELARAFGSRRIGGGRHSGYPGLGGGLPPPPRTVVGLASTIEYWRAASLVATPVGSWLGGKYAEEFAAAGTARPAWSATGGGVGLPGVTFDGGTDLMSCTTIGARLVGKSRVAAIMICKDTTGADAIPYEYATNAATSDAGSFGAYLNDGADGRIEGFGRSDLATVSYGMRRTDATMPFTALTCVAIVHDLGLTSAVESIINTGPAETLVTTSSGTSPVGALGNFVLNLGARAGVVAPYTGTICAFALLDNPSAADLDFAMRKIALDDGGITWP